MKNQQVHIHLEEVNLIRYMYMDDPSKVWSSSTVKEGSLEADQMMKKVPFYKLFAFSDGTDKVLIIMGVIGAIAHGLTLPVMSFVSGQLIDAFGHSSPDNILASSYKFILQFVYLAVSTGIASFLQVSCWMVIGERQAVKVRALYLKAILQQDIAYFDQQVSTGEVTRRMSADTILIQQATGEKVGKCIEVVASFIGGFVVAFAKGWLLTLLLLSSIPLLVISGAIMFHIRSKIALRPQEAYVDAANLVQQTLGSIRTVASFTGEKQVVASYNKLLSEAYKLCLGEGFYSGLCVGIVMCILVSNYALLVWFGGRMILHNGYNGGQVCTIILAIVIGSCSLGQVSSSIAAFSAGQVAAFSMFETINRKPDIDIYDTKGKILSHIRGDIEFRDICFSYPTRLEEKIFDRFTLFIPSRMTTALVGQSGSGKSTVISLIERFYDPQAGKILIDGIDLRSFQLKWIRSKIGLVSQEPVLFTTSIKDNIAYGKIGGAAATLPEIRAAAQLANAIGFIDKLPQGLDTMVGENGIQLSGGQKQRIAIARAVLKDPQILLLDEATSALDAESEKTVHEALENLMVNRTTVLVAHRLCTVRKADVIAVLHKGKLVEKGTHFELLKDPNGVYFNLTNSQEQNVDNEYKSDTVIEDEISQDRNLSMNLRSDVNGESRRCSISNVAVVKEHITYPTITATDSSSIYRLFCLNKKEVPLLIIGVIFAIVTGGILPLLALIFSSAVGSFFELSHELKRDSEFWAIMFILLGAVSLIAYPIKTHVFGLAGNKLVQRIRLMCFEKVVNMDVSWFDEPENLSGKLSARLNYDTAIIRALVGDALAKFVELASSLVFGLAIAFAASWRLSIIMLVIMPAIGLAAYVVVKATQGFSRDEKEMYAEASQVANDAVGNIRTVASFCTQENIIETYKKKCNGPAANGTKKGLVCGMQFGMSMCLVYLVFAASFYAGARLIHAGETTVLDVFRVYTTMNFIAISIASSLLLGPDSAKAKSAAASIFSILDRKSKIDPSDEFGMSSDNVNGEIALKNVCFTYPNRPGIQILRNLTLRIHSGQTVALVGKSGSGKSTVISLLQRFYDPDSGQITLDGVEIHKYQVKWLRQQMGLVSQEPMLFNLTIRANIASGREGNVTEEEIIAAAKLANAHEFITGLQEGYDTLVGEHGIQLSGGQKQRVAIARAILKGPKILLLDEATSALDSESEKIVQEALDRVMLNRTTVVVAHRLSTIRGADTIAVFQNGSIVEKGNHSTLITIEDGLYSSLVRLHNSTV